LRDKVSPVDVEPGFRADGANDAGGLVQKAYDQLKARKESIEAELARIEALRAEHESVAAQVAALDEAMNAFKPQGERQRKAG
jgi:predicted transcriptional regulator